MEIPHFKAVPRLKLEQLTVATFHYEYVRTARPLHLTNTTGSWRARNWTVEHLRETIGQKRVRMFYNRNSTFDYNSGSGTGAVTIKRLPFADALELIYSEKGGNYYIQQQNIATEFPELLADIDRPFLLNQWKVIDFTNIWIGGKGCRTPLHYDMHDNFLVQVSGRKRIDLFSPDQSGNLYPAAGDILQHCSRVNVFAPDFGSYPLYEEAERQKLQIILEAGDTLYIPAKWWHAVESLEPSISVNFWWHSLT